MKLYSSQLARTLFKLWESKWGILKTYFRVNQLFRLIKTPFSLYLPFNKSTLLSHPRPVPSSSSSKISILLSSFTWVCGLVVSALVWKVEVRILIGLESWDSTIYFSLIPLLWHYQAPNCLLLTYLLFFSLEFLQGTATKERIRSSFNQTKINMKTIFRFWSNI